MDVTRHASVEMLGAEAPSRIAADSLSRILDCFLRAAGDPLGELDAVLAQNPHLVMGHLLRAAIGVAAKDSKALPQIRTALSAAECAAVRSTRHGAHLAAARAWVRGESLVAAERYAAILREWPQDLLALRLAQSCYFFLGRRAALRDVVELVWPAWSSDMPGYEYVLAMAAFGHAENGDAARAEALAREALGLKPAFPFAIHAVAHALFECGDHARGASWMRQHQAQWLAGGRMVSHNAWHAAMFDLESGDAARALTTMDRWIMPRAIASASEAADATALLRCLELDGLDPGPRWSILSNCWAAHGSPGFWPLLDLHAAIAFSAATDTVRLQSLVDAIAARACLRTDSGRMARTLTLPALFAIQAGALGDFEAAHTRIGMLRPALTLVGSHAQAELLERILLGASRKRPRMRAYEQSEWATAA